MPTHRGRTPTHQGSRRLDRRPLVAVLAALALLTTGCGDDESPTATEAPATTSTTTSATTSSTDAGESERSAYGVDLSGLELADGEAYETYVLVEDDTEQVEAEVPTDWDDLDTRPAERNGREVPGIWASTDLDLLAEGYDVPGGQLDLRTARSVERLLDLLADDNATVANCAGPETFAYDDGLYVGEAELWTDCGTSGAALLHVVALREGDQYVTTEVQMVTDPDIDAALQILETFRAVAVDGEGSEDSGNGDDSASGTDVTAAIGERFTLSVDANPSVGDDWQVADTFDDAIVSFVDEDFESDDPTGQAVGAGGTVTFTFEAVGRGETVITLENCFRCADDSGEITNTIEYAVNVD